jgi:hypothetical protein
LKVGKLYSPYALLHGWQMKLTETHQSIRYTSEKPFEYSKPQNACQANSLEKTGLFTLKVLRILRSLRGRDRLVYAMNETTERRQTGKVPFDVAAVCEAAWTLGGENGRDQ